MAKELPYFKFEPNQWENGNIQTVSREDKGLFIDLCSIYWSRLGDLPLKLAVQKLCAGNATALNSLCDENIIEVIDGNIYIKFLSEQLQDFDNVSTQNSKNAKDRWEKHRKQKAECDRNATASIPQCENDAIREEEIKEEDITIAQKEIDFESFWDAYDKKNDKVKTKKKFMQLKDAEIYKILLVVNHYVKSTPNPKFRKNPLTWLNGKCWQDEEIGIVSNEYPEDIFISNWVLCIKQVKKQDSNLKELNFEEKELLYNALKKYTKNQINEAMLTLFTQKEMLNESMWLRPQHFLDKIDVYYSGNGNTKIWGN